MFAAVRLVSFACSAANTISAFAGAYFALKLESVVIMSEKFCVMLPKLLSLWLTNSESGSFLSFFTFMPLIFVIIVVMLLASLEVLPNDERMVAPMGLNRLMSELP